MAEPRLWVSLPESETETGDAWCEPDDRYGVDHRLRLVAFDEAIERMVDEHLRQQGQEVAVVRGAMPRFVEAGRDYCRRLLAAALGDG